MYDVIVIGSGITGMTSAMYLKRANKNILIIEGYIPGGLLNKISIIENYPGFVSIDGPSLAMNLYEQINKLDVEYKAEMVVEILDEGGHKTVKTNNGDYKTKKIIIATGRIPKHLGLENENELIGKGISFCSICDGLLYKNKTVMVVGGGNSALEQALYLAPICKKVILVHRRNKFKGEELRIKRVMATQNIEIHYNSEIIAINESNDMLKSVVLNEKKTVKIDGLFVAIGYTPNFNIKTNFELETNHGYIMTDETMKTSIQGIYAAGDIINKRNYQLSTAVGEGAQAALSIINNE